MKKFTLKLLAASIAMTSLSFTAHASVQERDLTQDTGASMSEERKMAIEKLKKEAGAPETIKKEQSVLKLVQEKYPKLGVTKAQKIPNLDLYSLRVNSNVPLSFTDEKVTFFLYNGAIIEPSAKINVLHQADLLNTKDFFDNLPFDKAIKMKYGKGERRIAIFTDPDCPFCHATDMDIFNNFDVDDNVTIYYFMNPLVELLGHEQAPEKAKRIWCSEDPAKAWHTWMTKRELPKNDGQCDNPVQENMKLSREAGFNLTPIIVFDAGVMWKGRATAEGIRNVLAQYPEDTAYDLQRIQELNAPKRAEPQASQR